MKHIIDPLHKIIQSISEEEKKQFKQYIANGKTKSNAVEMFECFEKMKSYDVEVYNKYILRKSINSIASSVKSQLKEKLVNWLAKNNKAPEGTNWFHGLAVAETYMRFELYDEAYKLFVDLKEEMNNNNMLTYEWLVLSYLSVIVQSLPPDQVISNMIEISERQTVITHKIYFSAKAFNFYIRTVSIYYKYRTINKIEIKAQVEQLRREHFFSDDDSFVPLEQAVYIFYARALIYQMQGNLDKAYIEITKLFNRILDFEDKFIKHQHNEYGVATREKLYHCIITNRLDEYETMYLPYYKKVLSGYPLKSDYELRLESINLLYLIKQKKQEALKAELIRMDEYKYFTNYLAQPIANRKEAILHEGYSYQSVGDLEKAISRFEEVIQLNEKEVGADYDVTARLMILLINFIKTYQNQKLIYPSTFIENQAKSYYEFLLKNKIDSPFEKLIIKFMRDIAAGGSTNQQKLKVDKHTLAASKAIEQINPYYQLQLAEFDWLSWFHENLHLL